MVDDVCYYVVYCDWCVGWCVVWIVVCVVVCDDVDLYWLVGCEVVVVVDGFFWC